MRLNYVSIPKKTSTVQHSDWTSNFLTFVHSKITVHASDKIDPDVCSKTCLVGLLIRFCAGETALALKRSCNLPTQIERINRPSRHVLLESCICFFIRATTSWKLLMNNKFKAQTLIGNPTGIVLCHVLASRALNISWSFGQSGFSIESRCVVITLFRLMNICFVMEVNTPGTSIYMTPSNNTELSFVSLLLFYLQRGVYGGSVLYYGNKMLPISLTRNPSCGTKMINRNRSFTGYKVSVCSLCILVFGSSD